MTSRKHDLDYLDDGQCYSVHPGQALGLASSSPESFQKTLEA